MRQQFGDVRHEPPVFLFGEGCNGAAGARQRLHVERRVRRGVRMRAEDGYLCLLCSGCARVCGAFRVYVICSG